MVRLLEIGLVGAVGVAVLAFGGTAPLFFAITQVIILGLGVLFILSGQVSRITSTHIPIVSPLLLFAFVLLQVCPLPVSLAPLFGRTPDDLVVSLISLSAWRRTKRCHTFCYWSPT